MKVIILIYSVIITGGLVAQNVGVNANGVTPDASAMLDVKSTDKGLLIPRVDIANLTTAAPVTAPVNSLLVYNTNTTTGIGYYYWNATTKWTKLVDASTPVNDHDWYEVGTTTAPDNINDDIFTQGKVGIGVAVPIYPLEIVSSSNIGLSVESTDAVSRIRVVDDISEVAIIASQENMQFSTNGTLNADVKMTIEKFGNVGIGTTNPSSALQIVRAENTVYDEGVQQITGEGATMRIVNNDNTVGSFSQISFSTRASSAGQSRIVSINGGVNQSSLAFVTEEASVLSEKMRILNNGNVGIGTKNPQTELEIIGDGLPLSISAKTYTGVGDKVGLQFWQLTHNNALRVGGAVASIKTDTYTGGVGSTYDSDLAFFSSLDGFLIEGMRLSDDGNVGINTTSPTERLEINGSIKITDGTQGAGKVLVSDANGKGSWSNTTSAPTFISPVFNSGQTVLSFNSGSTIAAVWGSLRSQKAIVKLRVFAGANGTGYYYDTFAVTLRDSPQIIYTSQIATGGLLDSLVCGSWQIIAWY